MEDVYKKVLQGHKMLNERPPQIFMVKPKGNNPLALRIPGPDGFDLLR
jgi:hypothetical protein